MNLFTAMLTTMALLASAPTQAQTLVITRGGSRPAQPASAANFTGGVHVEELFEALDPSHASGGSVTFEPRARTAWHSHPRGQILIVTAGTGRVQRWGDPIQEVRQGDVVRIPAGEKHWHGASPQASMTHMAITEHRDGTRVQWMEKVSDEQYNGLRPSPERHVQPARPRGQSESQSQPSSQRQGTAGASGALQKKIAPGLATFTDDVLFGDVWRRAELSPRDRSLVTISVLIATGKPAQLAGHLGRALNNGVQPSEASGLLAHLAMYCGWPSAVSALDVYDQVYTARKVDTVNDVGLGAGLHQHTNTAIETRDKHCAPSARAFKLPPRTRHEPGRRRANWRPSRRSSCSSPTRWSLTTSGGDPISVCGIAAWSPLRRSPLWVTTTSSISTCAAGSRAV